MTSPAPSPSVSIPAESQVGLSIAAVERETGLAKGTLRIWEKRYGFPSPARDPSGDRQYSFLQVQQLKLISKLLGAGMRPSKVVGLDSAQLQAMLIETVSASPANLYNTKLRNGLSDPQLDKLLDAIGEFDSQTLRHRLNRAQLQMGLAPFVIDLVAPLTTAVGIAWAQGRFEVYEEHFFTEVITGVLRHAIDSLTPQPAMQAPKVLLTTLSQEQHGLGLLMVEALLQLEGCHCVSLGTQTPVADIIQAAQAHSVDVVALSFSNVHKAAVVQTSLRELRVQLPVITELWVGGACNALYQKEVSGLKAMRHLSDLQPQVAEWRRTHHI